MLLDYDTCSNYGNWLYVAGVGTDPREDRYFNVIKQATMYGKSFNNCYKICRFNLKLAMNIL